jgi:DnaJ-class molecular chaperone
MMSVEVEIKFERECGICFGRSARTKGDICTNCNSTGRVPTQLGRDLLEFLENQGFKPATTNESKQS